MSGSFGPRKPIRLSNGELSPSFHGGVDFTPLAAGSKLPAYAVGRGVVYGVGLGGKAAGLNVMLRLSDGSLWWYCHLSRVDVAKGQAVTDGEQIGHIGATGNTTGVHLHLERHYPRLDAETDPWPFIKDEPDPTGKTGDKNAAQPTKEALTMADIDDIIARLDRLEHGLLHPTEGRGKAIENGINWLKQRIGGSVLSGDDLTGALNGLNQSQLRSLADEVGKRITNG